MLVTLWGKQPSTAYRLRQRKGCSGHRPIRRRQQTKLERVRPQGKKKHRQRKPVIDVIRYITDSERFLAALLTDLNIYFVSQKQVAPFELDLTGKGRTHFQPDFKLLHYNVYLEVHEGKNPIGIARKLSKIASAERMGKRVVFIGLTELGALNHDPSSIWDYIIPETALKSA